MIQTEDNSEYNFLHSQSLNDFEYEDKDPVILMYGLPLLLTIFLFFGFLQHDSFAVQADNVNDNFLKESEINSNLTQSEFNILTEEDLAQGLLDTVYTDKECWLELIINEQMVYQHWRNGKTTKYPVSTGNKYLDKGLETRPGLFAIFFKNEHHESSQFDNADMYHFMPFNQGIGFHSINGTGYYQHLGVRPSSHGCIRMKHDDVKKLFADCPLGTIVLAHNGGKTARTVAFAPKDYDIKSQNYTHDEYKKMLADNLYYMLNGKYYKHGKKFFVIDPTVIPKQGVYIGYDRTIPKVQEMPSPDFIISYVSDKLNTDGTASKEIVLMNAPKVSDEEETELVSNEKGTDKKDAKNDPKNKKNIVVAPPDDIVKKYFNNPIGILPYYPPVKKVVVSSTE